jgi:myo-inositol 2-dehydrogenase / D-chiro-inositol 1-dehydrogenase
LRKPLAVGVVGLGRIGKHHVETLLGVDGVSVTVTDADPERARQVADEHGVRALGNPEELLEARVDAFVIATATPAHASLLRMAARAGVPAFCEKPVALDLETMDAVIADVAAAGILVQVGFQRRFDAGYRALRAAVANGEAGRILAMRAATHDPFPPAEEYLAASGGIFRDLHIHDFDAIRFVSGEEIVEVYADGSVLETPWLEEHGDVDVAATVLRLSGGALVIVSGTRHDPLGYDARLEVFGSKDSLVAGLDDRTPLHSRPGPAYRDFWDRFEPAYRSELEAFVTSVREDGESACRLAEGRAALVVALAADLSLAEHRPVALAKPPPNR